MKELAKYCARTEIKLTITKLQAAQNQLEGAIANLFLGNWPAAITLAGAVEDSLPTIDAQSDFYTEAKKSGADVFKKTEKNISDEMNELRNWLKHDKTEITKEITQQDVLVMVLRAYSRFRAHHEPIEPDAVLSESFGVFEHWLSKNYPDWISGNYSDSENLP